MGHKILAFREKKLQSLGKKMKKAKEIGSKISILQQEAKELSSSVSYLQSMMWAAETKLSSFSSQNNALLTKNAQRLERQVSKAIDSINNSLADSSSTEKRLDAVENNIISIFRNDVVAVKAEHEYLKQRVYDMATRLREMSNETKDVASGIAAMKKMDIKLSSLEKLASPKGSDKKVKG